MYSINASPFDVKVKDIGRLSAIAQKPLRIKKSLICSPEQNSEAPTCFDEKSSNWS